MRVLIVGCGYVGLALGAELARLGHEVFGLRRTSSASGDLKSAGIKPLTCDITKLRELSRFPSAYDWVVNCASSSAGGVDEYRAVFLEGTRNLIEWLRPNPPQKFVYTSSTSVYGQTDGSLVDEQSPTQPETETAKVLVETERVLLNEARDKGFPAVILRVAGIYGPTRGYWFKQFLKNEARIEGNGERLTNMIHRDDVAGAIIAALEKGHAPSIYNAVDDEPVSQLACFQWFAEKLGKPLPPFATGIGNVAAKRGLTNKRVSNRRLKLELGYQFKDPTFRQGYAAEISRLQQEGKKIGSDMSRPEEAGNGVI